MDESLDAYGHDDQDLRYNTSAAPIQAQGCEAKHAHVLRHSQGCIMLQGVLHAPSG